MADAAPNDRVGALIRWGAARLSFSSTPLLDARALAKTAFALDDVALVTGDLDRVSEDRRELFASMIERRAQGEPVAYIVGRREFWSLNLEVVPGVLVPRPDSETLVSAVLGRRSSTLPLEILELGCGSGALLCALLKEFPAARAIGVDINPAAVSVTTRNLNQTGISARGRAVHGDWFGPVQQPFDVIISNPPYIKSGDRDSLPRDVRDFESNLALFAGEDGCDAYRAILARAPRWLNEGGLVVLELGDGQSGIVKELAIAAFPTGRITVDPDLAGRPRALVIDLGGVAD